MVKIILYHLLRSKYRIGEVLVHAGTINDMIDEMITKHPQMEKSDFMNAIVFHEGKPIHKKQFDRVIDDEQKIIITHFVGGG